ncbi:MAG: DNA cytosine methyltransferase [Synergistaceae bacterium]|nr:DNA cytosine methyltransferase [Synergistaceae bacterium]
MQGLSLFSGIGGLDLAFEQAGGTVIAMCEINSFCQRVLRRHWPDVPVFWNVKELHGSDVSRTVDVIYGGFPCQPFSVAGDQRGKDDSRYLWPEFSRLVSEIKPRWIVAENVPGILRIAADDVCSDLERQGYSVGIWDFEAASVGAQHRRERIFFVAHSGRSLQQGIQKTCDFREENEKGSAFTAQRSGCTHKEFTGSNFGRRTEPGMDRAAHEISHRVLILTERLRALGNAVVPRQAYPVFRAVMEADEQD